MDGDNSQLVQPDQITIDMPSLSLPITDAIVLQTLDYAETRGKTVRQKYQIDERATLNANFWKGKQVDESRLDSRYQMAHVDNVVRQNLENKIKLATGHMPDIFASSPDEQDFNVEASRDLQNYMRDRLTSSVNKRLLKNGLRKLDIDLIGIIKCRYDHKQQKSVYELIDSKDILFGEGAKVVEDGFTIDGTDILFHYVERPTQEVLNTFPSKAQELLGMLGASGKEIPSRLRFTEAHFRWYDRDNSVQEGVVWRYGTLVLDKMRQPYYDRDNPRINYFDRPRKPFILLSYANLGETVYESTTDFEQGIPINRIINRRRRQVTEINDRAVPKLAFMGGAMTKELASNISSSPSEAIILSDAFEGTDIRNAMTVIPATPPSPILYNDMLDLRGRLNSMFAVQGATNVEAGKNVGESGVSKQITREGDLVTSDDIGEIVVERVISEMAAWEMQFLRLFCDDDRPPYRIIDREGETERIQINRKKIETDIQIVVKASNNDKQVRRADALQMLAAKAIDPYTLMEDLDVNNPKERFRRLMAFIESSKTGDFSSYLEAVNINIETPFATEQDAQRDIDILSNGQQVQVRLPSEKYVSTFMAFKQSPEYAQLDEFSKMMIDNHIQKLKMLVDEEVAKQQAQQGVDSQQMAALEQGQGGFMPQTADTFAGQQPQNPLMAALQQRQAAPQQSMQAQPA